MPKFDGTGPQGQGAMTGRGMGPCGQGMAYGRGFGRGVGNGFCRWSGFFNRKPTKTEEVADMKSYVEGLKAELVEAEKYLKDIEGKK